MADVDFRKDITIEKQQKLLNRYRAELSAIMERCLQAEEDRDTFKGLYEFYQNCELKANKALAEEKKHSDMLTEYKEELLTKLMYAEEWITDHDGDFDKIVAVEPEDEEEDNE